jgi:hypothetical protein
VKEQGTPSAFCYRSELLLKNKIKNFPNFFFELPSIQPFITIPGINMEIREIFGNSFLKVQKVKVFFLSLTSLSFIEEGWKGFEEKF